MTTITPADAADCIAYADFRHQWPVNVRQTLVRAAQTEGDLPPYAIRKVAGAMKVATAIELRLDAQARENDARRARRFS